MAHRMTRRKFAALGGAGLGALALGRPVLGADSKSLRFIVRTDLRVLDPIWTTAYVSRNHGYMIFDTLFALDSKFRPQPQMVGDFSISPDKLQYRFALRPGLKFHDGQPVRGADCVASLRRWMARDALGQALAATLDEMTGGDDAAFTIRLKEPFPLLLEGLAKVSSRCRSSCPSGWPRPTPTSRSPTPSALARSYSCASNSSLGTRRYTSGTSTTCRVVSRRIGHRAAK
jgi:peptide/nickel transport system substrate-binding protein